MFAGNTQTCSTLLSGAGCHVLVQTERIITYFAGSVILAMALPIIGFFTVDLVTYAIRNTLQSFRTRDSTKAYTPAYKRLDFTFKSTSLVRKYFQDLSALLQESRSRWTKFGIRVEDE